MPLVADDYRRRDPSFPDVDGRDGQQESVTSTLNAFPDLSVEVLRRVVDGDLVAVDVVLIGTHQGEPQKHSATGKKVSFQSHETYRVRDGKVVQQYVLVDTLGLLQQLGVIPPMGYAR